MRKFGRTAIHCIVERAIQKFMEDDSYPEFVCFFWKGHFVEAEIEWSDSKCDFYVSHFSVIYSRCVMRYNVNEDYDLCFALCSYF